VTKISTFAKSDIVNDAEPEVEVAGAHDLVVYLGDRRVKKLATSAALA
jgi:hypothetical protein